MIESKTDDKFEGVKIMRLYHYAPKDNNILKTGLFSYSKHPRGLKRNYSLPAGSNKKKDIVAWLEKLFPGRSRAVSCLTEPIKWRGNDSFLKGMVKRSVLLSFDLDDLIKAGLVESIWCRDDIARKGRKYTWRDVTQYFYKVSPKNIDVSPLPWEKVSVKNQIIWGAVRHYMIVLKKGVIPPEYLRVERTNLGFFYNLSQSLKGVFVHKK